MALENQHHSRWLVNLAAFFIVIAGLKLASEFVVPMILAMFFATIAAPAYFFLQRRSVPSPIALVLVIAFFLLLIGLIVTLVGSSVTSFTAELPAYEAALKLRTAGLFDWLREKGFDVSEFRLLDNFDPSQIMQLAAGVFNGLSGVLGNTFLITFTGIFMLLEASRFSDKFAEAFPGSNKPGDGFNEIIAQVKRYTGLKTIVSLMTGAVISLWLWLIGVDYPLLWGLLAFLLNFIPNIGSFIAAIPAVLLAWVQAGSVTALLAAAGFVVVNVVVGNMIEPKFMGKGLGLSTLVVFLSLVFWGWVLGSVGMLLSVPLTIIVKIILSHSRDMKWLAILLGK